MTIHTTADKALAESVRDKMAEKHTALRFYVEDLTDIGGEYAVRYDTQHVKPESVKTLTGLLADETIKIAEAFRENATCGHCGKRLGKASAYAKPLKDGSLGRYHTSCNAY